MNRFMVHWCRFFIGWNAVVLVLGIAGHSLLEATLATMALVGHLYYLDLFQRRCDEKGELS